VAIPSRTLWRRLRRWHSSARVSFMDAVPLRADRRELRRRLRSAARTTRAERKRRVTARLEDLAMRRVPVASVRPGVLGDQLVEFVDGTRVWLDVRDGTTAIRRLAARSSCQDIHLGCVEPCFGSCWYQLRFSTVGETGPMVLVRVKQFESGTMWLRWVPSHRWHRRHHEQSQG